MSIAPDWFNGTAGQYLLEKEQPLYDKAVFDLFGFNALQMGSLHCNLLQNSRIPNQFLASHQVDANLKHHLCCQDDFLPFAEMSLDLLLLPHRLEFSELPHQTLREAARVLVHDGHLLISGFNPVSVWGMTARFKKMSKSPNYPWNGQFIGLARLKDWLTLLGFEVASVQMVCYVPPFEQVSWQQRFASMDKLGAHCCTLFGGVYFIIAKKRVAGMTPIKPHWKVSPLKAGLVVRQPKSHTTQSEINKELDE
ncbi:MAG TPA: methyltransferase domain-containing protein [Methylotenera sp.]|nr:methyltransferase domain-containing protein [Methylotenera sp.]HPH04485.1 methyltransferase domain-containing protein [Methylotenera sp.]HPN00890.1 methyltransferase domain-containing protein [Methylotenera sp.]